MQYKLTFGRWSLPGEGSFDPGADQARVWASLWLAFKQPPATSQTPGGKNLSATETLDASLELIRFFKGTREAEGKQYLCLSGATYEISGAAFELLKHQWTALRSSLGPSVAEDVQLVEQFFDHSKEQSDALRVTKFDPNDTVREDNSDTE